MQPARAPDARVVVLAGPSGAGKSRLGQRLHAAYGWPVVRLDDFYRDGDDPDLPQVVAGGSRLPDWDDPASWEADAAVAALAELVATGHTQLPDYDIGLSQAVGSHRIDLPTGQLVVAKGIFAAEIVPELRRRGLLAAAWCVTQGRWRTFARRLVRDLAERRKPPLVLLGRGWQLARRQPAVVRRAAALGATVGTPAAVGRALVALGAAQASDLSR